MACHRRGARRTMAAVANVGGREPDAHRYGGLMDLLAALILIAVGAAALFVGFKLWLVLLPIFGFFVGFVVGAELISTWLGDGFLQNVLGIVVGAVTAVIFA